MRYRRNPDNKLRQMEREWAATANRELLIPINRERLRMGLPPHPDARIIIANNALFELLPRFASQLTTALQVYDEIDIPMHLAELPEQGIREQLMALTDEIQTLENQRRILDRANIDMRTDGELREEYTELLEERNAHLPTLGEIPEIDDPEPEAGFIPFYSKEMLQQRGRSGFEQRAEQWGWMLQLLSRRALRIFRKLLLYGAIPMGQILPSEFDQGNVAEDWFDTEWHELDELADNIEITTNEIVDVTQGFGPSPEARVLLEQSWY